MEEERDINDGCERESKMNGEGEKKDDRRGRQWRSEAEKDGKTAREREREIQGERDKRCKVGERAIEERKVREGCERD